MKLRKRIARFTCTLAAVLMLVAMLAACGGGASSSTAAPAEGEAPAESGEAAEGGGASADGIKKGGVMVIGQGAEPISLNPDGKSDDNIPPIAQNVFQRLVKTNNNQEVVNDLATDIQVSEDGMTYTFTLPDNVRFHDGEALTSDDVKFTFEEILKQSGFASPNLSAISEITCPDDTTVVFQLSQPDAGFLGTLAYNGTFILPRHVYEGKDWIDADSMMDPVGSGPFKYESWDKGVSITLVRNDDFYLGPDLPYLDKVIFSYITDVTTAVQSFYNGELDILGVIAPSSDLETMMTNPDITCDYVVYPSRFYVGFNFEDELMANDDFRLAVAHAIDADDMINKAMKTVGMKAEAYISPVFEWAVNHDPSAAVPAFDLDKAKEYMEKTGLTPDANGVYTTVTVDTYNYEPFPDMAVVLKDQLSKIGVDVTINMLEYAAWEEKVGTDRDFTMVLSGGYQGPSVSAVGDRIATDGILNYYGFSDPALDEQLKLASEQPTQDAQVPYYHEVQQMMADDLPHVLISEWLGYIPYHSYMKGVPYSGETVEKTAFGEFTYTWIDK